MSEALIVKLGELEHDPVATEGHEKRLTQIEDLLASLPAKGLLQSLNVRPAGSGKAAYWVKAGNRRLAALRHCRDNGIEILGKKVTNNFEVAVIYSEEDDAAAYETSRTENMMRLPETPVEEFRAFAKMAESKPVKEIAGIFGVTPKRVEQRLKLAQLHPDVLAALESSKITMEAAEAFTLAEPDAQAAYLKKAGTYELQPYAIKGKFTQKLVNGKSAIAKLIGTKAYKAAGGRVLGDVFNDDAYWIDTKLLDELVEKHWEAQVAEWKAEGWGFVETVAQFCGTSTWKLYQSDRIKGEAPYSEAEKAKFGVVYYPDGKDAPIIGIKRYVERSERGRGPVASLDALTSDLSSKLRGAIVSGVSSRLSAEPSLALALIVATLRTGQFEYSPLSIQREYPIPSELGEDGDQDDDKMMSFEEALDDVRGKGLDELLASLAELLSPAFEPRGRLDEKEKAFVAFVEPTVTFDADGYFAELTKPYLDLCWTDMTGEKPPKGSKLNDAYLEKVKGKAAETGWLPPQLRLADYAGPHALDGNDEPDESESEPDESQLEAAE